jgi:hypothetical protein
MIDDRWRAHAASLRILIARASEPAKGILAGKRLRRGLARMQAEPDILEKAAACFARDSL